LQPYRPLKDDCCTSSMAMCLCPYFTSSIEEFACLYFSCCVRRSTQRGRVERSETGEVNIAANLICTRASRARRPASRTMVEQCILAPARAVDTRAYANTAQSADLSD
jgi:hypothetical protein